MGKITMEELFEINLRAYKEVQAEKYFHNLKHLTNPSLGECRQIHMNEVYKLLSELE